METADFNQTEDVLNVYQPRYRHAATYQSVKKYVNQILPCARVFLTLMVIYHI